MTSCERSCPSVHLARKRAHPRCQKPCQARGCTSGLSLSLPVVSSLSLMWCVQLQRLSLLTRSQRDHHRHFRRLTQFLTARLDWQHLTILIQMELAPLDALLLLLLLWWWWAAKSLLPHNHLCQPGPPRLSALPCSRYACECFCCMPVVALGSSIAERA